MPGNATFDIPRINLEDGPQGVADGATLVTAWPSALTVTMTWDMALAELWGSAMGAEQATKGTNVMLGPAVNLARVPWAGRNFEYMGKRDREVCSLWCVTLRAPPLAAPSQAKTQCWRAAWLSERSWGFRATISRPASSTG